MVYIWAVISLRLNSFDKGGAQPPESSAGGIQYFLREEGVVYPPLTDEEFEQMIGHPFFFPHQPLLRIYRKMRVEALND